LSYIKSQVVERSKTAPFGHFAIQLEKSTDITLFSQLIRLMVLAKYICNGTFKQEFLCCSSLEAATKAADVLQKVSIFFACENLEWQNLAGCCTGDVPAMLGCNSGFHSSVKRQAPKTKGIHSLLHRQSLASKTLPESHKKVQDQIIEIITFIKRGALNSWLFKMFCADMDFDQQVVLHYTQVQWLSKGNVTQRVFELRKELKAFCKI